MNDQTQVITGDDQHFWPGGINYHDEVTEGSSNSYGEVLKGERMLRCNVMVVNAMQIDGLICPQP